MSYVICIRRVDGYVGLLTNKQSPRLWNSVGPVWAACIPRAAPIYKYLEM